MVDFDEGPDVFQVYCLTITIVEPLPWLIKYLSTQEMLKMSIVFEFSEYEIELCASLHALPSQRKTKETRFYGSAKV